MFNMFKKMFSMSKEATQSKWDNLCSNSLTAWEYSTYTQVPESRHSNLSCIVIVNDPMLQCNVQVNHLKVNYKIVLKAVTPI